jgi:hypothetical protein
VVLQGGRARCAEMAIKRSRFLLPAQPEKQADLAGGPGILSQGLNEQSGIIPG